MSVEREESTLMCPFDVVHTPVPLPVRQRITSAGCRRVAVEEYSLEVQARRYAELYEGMIG